MDVMDVMPAGRVMDVVGVMVVAVAMDVTAAMAVVVAMDAMAVAVTAAGVIRSHQVTVKDVRVNVERAVTVARPTARRGTA